MKLILEEQVTLYFSPHNCNFRYYKIPSVGPAVRSLVPLMPVPSMCLCRLLCVTLLSMLVHTPPRSTVYSLGVDLRLNHFHIPRVWYILKVKSQWENNMACVQRRIYKLLKPSGNIPRLEFCICSAGTIAILHSSSRGLLLFSPRCS